MKNHFSDRPYICRVPLNEGRNNYLKKPADESRGDDFEFSLYWQS